LDVIIEVQFSRLLQCEIERGEAARRERRGWWRSEKESLEYAKKIG
jgi:hypothetical protein